ncbi:uncharacterized protein LOC127780785 [Oryza glaberrima]|uniref:uncharacterized protein LOC127780785 n=1 Tax=Oryza glaberrima TaxID=4538 RepID=UPI00224C343E|nr:uncharacterized protein LOC127780785 [Oryza glaberrima]
MALRALASNLRMPAVFRRAPASRSAAPQDMVGNIAPPKPAYGDPLLERMMEQKFRAYERKLMCCNIAGRMLGSSAALCFIYYLCMDDFLFWDGRSTNHTHTQTREEEGELITLTRKQGGKRKGS